MSDPTNTLSPVPASRPNAGTSAPAPESTGLGAPQTLPPGNSSSQWSSEFLSKVDELEKMGSISARSASLLRGKAQNELRCGKLTNEQADQAARVIESINDPVMVEKFLLNGGVALLAKLDGVPPALQQRIFQLVADRKIFLKSLGQVLDKYHGGQMGAKGEAEAKLAAFLERADQINSADELARLMQAGGVAKVIQGGGTSYGSGAPSGPIPAHSAVPSAATNLTGVSPNTTPQGPLSQSWLQAPGTKAALKAQEIETLLNDLSQQLIEAKNKREKEEGDDILRSGMWPSRQVLTDLQRALDKLSEIAGPEVTTAVRQLVQVLHLKDQLGADITIEQLLALFEAVRTDGNLTTERTTKPAPQITPISLTHEPNQPSRNPQPLELRPPPG